MNAIQRLAVKLIAPGLFASHSYWRELACRKEQELDAALFSKQCHQNANNKASEQLTAALRQITSLQKELEDLRSAFRRQMTKSDKYQTQVQELKAQNHDLLNKLQRQRAPYKGR